VSSRATQIGPSLARWFTEPVPLGRIAAFRTICYIFVALDLLFFTPWVVEHADVPGELYQPLFIGRILPLPTPNAWLVHTIYWALLVLTALAATGRAPRLLGWAVFVLYFEWMIIAMSYGKVDHDHFAFLLALALLPTLGRARHGDPTLSESAGWVIRMTQIAVIATYFLAAWAKFRFGGIEWLWEATLTRAVLRRGTVFSNWTTEVPGLLVAVQFGIIAFELLSPAVFFVRKRIQYGIIAFFYSFHAVTYASLTIAFWPHLVAMLCFLPLERIRPVQWVRARFPQLAGKSRSQSATADELSDS